MCQTARAWLGTPDPGRTGDLAHSGEHIMFGLELSSGLYHGTAPESGHKKWLRVLYHICARSQGLLQELFFEVKYLLFIT